MQDIGQRIEIGLAERAPSGLARWRAVQPINFVSGLADIKAMDDATYGWTEGLDIHIHKKPNFNNSRSAWI